MNRVAHQGNQKAVVHNAFHIGRINKWAEFVSKAFYSRKSNSNFRGTYKIVSKTSDGSDEYYRKEACDINWQLLAPQGFRFFLPGAIGPAWHDDISLSFIPSTLPCREPAELECEIKECPVLLRRGISELFPGVDPCNSHQLTVVSMSQKKSGGFTDQDVELLTKQFVCAAEEMCRKLIRAGYWADFINPFSGTARFHAGQGGEEGLMALGLSVKEAGVCKIIKKRRTSRSFIGSLFTNAPPSTAVLREILKEKL